MCIKYLDTYSCGHLFTSITVECLYGPCRDIKHKPGKQRGERCARLICRSSDWTIARVSDYDYDYPRRSERRVIRARDCGNDLGFRDERRRGRERVDVDEHNWISIDDDYVAAGHYRRTVRSRSLGEKPSVVRFIETIW
jgi:hypothetical protein